MAPPVKILVAGASGLLGTTLCPAFSGRGHEVVALGHSGNGETDRCADLCDPAAAAEIVADVEPEFVINLVALTDVDRCERDPRLAHLLNAAVVENLASAISGSDCRLVQISTDQIYGGPGPHGEDNVDIVNAYALSKFAGEVAAIEAGGTVLRTNFFGPSQLPGRTSFSDWALSRLRNGEEIRAFEDLKFSPLSMRTLVDAMAKVIERPAAGVFNLGSKDGMSKAQFIRTLARRFGFDESRIFSARSTDANLYAKRPPDMRMEVGRFEREFQHDLPPLEEEINGLELSHAPTEP